MNHLLITNDVSNNVNLDKILKLDLGYKKLGRIRTSLDYLDHIHKDVFVMIRQLGPPTFFVTFTIGVNNWPILIITLKELYDDYICKNVSLKMTNHWTLKNLSEMTLSLAHVIMNIK